MITTLRVHGIVRKAAFGSSLLLACVLPVGHLRAQNNTLDLRVVEFNNDHDITYQNVIYARSIAGGKYIAQALYLRLPRIKYNEVAIGAGIRIAQVAGTDVYAIAGAGSATDANYAEPAVLFLRTMGRFTGSLFVQRYVAIDDKGIDQWLVDPLELQYRVRGPVSIGASFYAYQAGHGDWLTKLGPKLSVADRWGASEVRVASVNQGGTEIQVRRIVIF